MARSQPDYMFPEDSVIKKIYRFRPVAIISYLMALMLQALQPVALAGLFKGSQGWDDIAVRAKRTIAAMETVFFGTRPAVLALVSDIHEKHKEVKGKLGPNGAELPENTVYSALDPRLQRWVIATLIVSVIKVYELLVEKLTPAEKDQLVREFKVVSQLFHVSENYWFSTHEELQSYMQSMYDTIDDISIAPHKRLGISPEHRDLVIRLITALPDDFAEMFKKDLPTPVRGMYSLSWALVDVKPGWKLALKGVLPARVRRIYGLRWSRLEAATFNATVGLTKTSLGFVRATEVVSEAWQEGMKHVPVLSATVPVSRFFTRLAFKPIQGPMFGGR